MLVLFGLAAFGERVAPKLPRRVTIAGAAVAVWWNLSLMVQHPIGLIPRNEGVSLGTLVWNQFVEVPRRLPNVAGRYLFDPRSLSKSDPAPSSAER